MLPHLGDQWRHTQPSPVLLYHAPPCRHKSHRSQLFIFCLEPPPPQASPLKPWGAGKCSFPNSQETMEKASIKRYIFLRGIRLIHSAPWNLAMQREEPRNHACGSPPGPLICRIWATPGPSQRALNVFCTMFLSPRLISSLSQSSRGPGLPSHSEASSLWEPLGPRPGQVLHGWSPQATSLCLEIPQVNTIIKSEFC